MGHDQPHSPLAIGELLEAVLRLLDHPKYLARCACVNREWYNLSIPLLWRGHHGYVSIWRGPYDYQSPWLTPDVEHLVKLAEAPDRFRHYISFVDTLVLKHKHRDRWYDQDLHADVLFHPSSRLWSTFAGLSVVVNLNSRTLDLNSLRVLVQPALQSLSTLCGKYNDGFLQYLNHTCTLSLLELHDSPDELISIEALRSCLQRNPLEHLKLEGYEELDDQEVCMFYFESPQCAGIASTLRSLYLSLESPVLKYVFHCLPNLESFRLIVTDDNHRWNISQDLLRPIAVCSHLRELFLSYHDRHAYFNTTDFLYFAQNCPRMEILQIYKMAYTPAFRPFLASSNELLTAVSLWPNLKFLNFDADLSTMTQVELSMIAKCCPKLEYLHLYGPVSANSFDDEELSFPCLRTVSFMAILCDPYPESHQERVACTQNFKAAVLKSMPRLNKLRPPTLSLYGPNNEKLFLAVIPYDETLGKGGEFDDLVPKPDWPEPMSLREQIRMRVAQRRR